MKPAYLFLITYNPSYMNQYMLDIDLPEHLDAEFMTLIPAQRTLVNELMIKGVISTYALALDRSKLWVVVLAETEVEAWEVYESFPLGDYMDPSLMELAFHNSKNVALPQLSLN